MRQNGVDFRFKSWSRLSSNKTTKSMDFERTSEDEGIIHVSGKIGQKSKKMSASKGKRAVSAAERLPSELILSIFKYISSGTDMQSCLLVCWSWCHCSIESLWYRPFLYQSSSLIKFCNTLCRKNLSFNYAQLIRRLNLSYVCDYVSDQYLSKLDKCTLLERLTLIGCKRVTDKGICDILSRNPNLLALDFTGLELITNKTLFCIAKYQKNLQGLNLTNCKNITDESIIAIAHSCSNLRRIKLNGCHLITDLSILSLASRCPSLLEMDLDNCFEITNQSVEAAFTRLNYLRELRLAQCTSITNELFLNMGNERYEHLRILDLTSCTRITDDCIYHISVAIPKLRNLILAKCSNITDRGVMYIARLGKNIHFLHLGHCSAITDRSIIYLSRYCSRLRYLDLACCIQLTDLSICELASLPKLKRIGLVKCANITDLSIFALANHKTTENALERIHLSYCVNLTLHAILELLNTCKKLTHLSLTGVSQFLQPEFTQFCRPSPRDFNPHQQAVFCVFSGSGVTKLRNHLNNLTKEAKIRTQFQHLALEETYGENNINNYNIPNETQEIFESFA
ncbi:SCF ubiquitin ligase complex subunit GRR1 [Pneumocystis jirovecii RU7]|uniref:Uncharacterized protein n=1 Tax=Pneumocystis jirovecii (strain RU7) TaxID=1408657 RepID=A0A0W4ZWQ3_PNEJ7|nr:SCF ubiquitin ligase complex subunit GRR1 [Pneumocystis jirovecii RU7]KTW32809.1 hypothetical protein T551_00294 [Pneumocystis jirovecii RU7]